MGWRDPTRGRHIRAPRSGSQPRGGSVPTYSVNATDIAFSMDFWVRAQSCSTAARRNTFQHEPQPSPVVDPTMGFTYLELREAD